MVADKIPEITPEMAEAGAAEWLTSHPDFFSLEEIAARIYNAMEKARLLSGTRR